MILTVLLAIFSTLPLAGCDLWAQLVGAYDEPYDLAVDVETPGFPVEVTEQVELAESALCSDSGSETCTIITAIDETDGQDDGGHLPDEFPVEITLEDDDGNALPDPDCAEPDPLDCAAWTVNVEDFVEENGLFSDIDLAQAIPVDLTEQVQVTSPDAVQAVSIRSIGLNWIDNALTFDSLPFDLYLTDDFLEDADANQLIADEAVEYIGTVDAQDALTSGVTPINFTDADAEARFGEALKKLKFTLVVVAPAEATITLKDGEEPGTKVKPQGQVDLGLVATLVYTVTASELVGEAKDAYEQSDIQNNVGF